jgi:hypothetical protein
VEAGLRRLGTLAVDYPGHEELIDTLRAAFDHEASHVMPPRDAPLDEAERERLEHRLIRDALITAQHEAVIRLRDDGHINDETMRRIERDLDLEALRASD